MSSKIYSAAVVGLDAELVEVEADTGGGDLGTFAMVGLPDAAVTESKERVRSAIRNSEFDFPKLKVTVNLAPADLKKHGPSYDLPIAVSILAVREFIRDSDRLREAMFVGELALNGKVRPVTGCLPIAIKAMAAGFKELYAPKENADEANLVEGLAVVPVDTLAGLVEHLNGREEIAPAPKKAFDFTNAPSLSDMSHIKGQEHVKRAMEIAAAGAHNILMSGPPGSGKTMIARTIPSILPDLTLSEALEITKIYSVAGQLPANASLVVSRPFRSPHHTASGVALVGGGAWPRPGEISLAHRGVLFLDEFPEYPRLVLESLRQPLEDGIINVSRAAGSLSFPAKFILVAAMNPCPCGYFGDEEKNCVCAPTQVINYGKKISGPILDRIDLHVEVPRIKFEKLTEEATGESSAAVKERIHAARKRQRERLAGTPFIVNSEMNTPTVKRICPLDQEGLNIVKAAVNQLHLSARSYFRILKLARTIADLEGETDIRAKHLAEALQYRPRMD